MNTAFLYSAVTPVIANDLKSPAHGVEIANNKKKREPINKILFQNSTVKLAKVDLKIPNTIQSRASIDLANDTSDSDSCSDVVMPSTSFGNGNEDHNCHDVEDVDLEEQIPLQMDVTSDSDSFSDVVMPSTSFGNGNEDHHFDYVEDVDLEDQIPMQMDVTVVPSTINDKSSSTSDGKIYINVDAMEQSLKEPSVITSGVSSFFKMILELNPFGSTSQAESSSEKSVAFYNDLNSEGNNDLNI